MGASFLYYGRIRGPAGWVLLVALIWVQAALLVVLAFWIPATARTGTVGKGLQAAIRTFLSRPLFSSAICVVGGLVLMVGAVTVVGLLLGCISVAGLWITLSSEAILRAEQGDLPSLSDERRLRSLWRPWDLGV